MAGFATRKTIKICKLTTNFQDVVDTGTGTDIYLVHNIVLHNTNTTTDATISIVHVEENGNEFPLWNIELEKNETLVLDFIGEGDIYEGKTKLKMMATLENYVVCKINGTVES